MARFKLTGKAYMNIIGTQWEQVETSMTGESVRVRHDVHRYLNPDEPRDCNYPGEIIVSTRVDRRYPKDYIFVGPPHQDMEPLDDEADKLYAEWQEKWAKAHPIESLPATGGF